MSTILDALRKVERDRDPAAEAAVEGPTISPKVRRRRPFPIAAVVICALAGFGGGALLSWVTSPPMVEVAALPPSPPVPEIAVPRAPVRIEPPGNESPAAAPVVPAVELAKAELPKADPASAPAAAVPAPRSEAAGDRGEIPAPTTRESSTLGETAGPMRPPDPPASVAINQGSALEPSPFGSARAAVREGSPPGNPAPGEAPRRVAPAEHEIAALAPATVPAEPPGAEVPEPEVEPEPPPATLFDTGRSPPGAPRVALSFLQWPSDPARRFAFISIDGAPTQRIHEGEVTAGLTVAAITPTGVQFKREGTTFVIRPRH